MKCLQIAAVAAALCAVVLISFGVSAEVSRQERVTISGCPYPGVTASCLMIKAANGPAYNISAISPRPRSSGRDDPRARQCHRQDERVRGGRRTRPHPLDAHAAALPEMTAGLCHIE